MKHEIKSSSDLGHAIRAVRKASGIRLDDLAGIVGVSKQTTSNLEYGKDTVSLGTVLRHLEQLGIRLYADISDPQAMQLLFKLSSGDPDAVERIQKELAKPPTQVVRPSGFHMVMEELAKTTAPTAAGPTPHPEPDNA
ncbi:hypothetical protein GCM10027276_08210 [Comamonas piscis]